MNGGGGVVTNRQTTPYLFQAFADGMIVSSLYGPFDNHLSHRSFKAE